MDRFDGLSFRSAPGEVMRPRPASERLVETASAAIRGRPARVADVGTGSGAIAVALAVREPLAEVWAVDVSEAAVALTRENAALHGVGGRVHPVAGDLLEGVPSHLDVVLANLPYLPCALAGDPDYAEYAAEPSEAIYAPGDGLVHYRRLVAQAHHHLAVHGLLVVQLRRAVHTATREQLDALLAGLERAAA